MVALKIVVEAKPRQKIDLTLAGKDYAITAPKSALALKMAVQMKTSNDDPQQLLDLLGGWIDEAFTEDDAKDVWDRLYSAKDLLDIPHLMETMEKVIEAVAENPTGSPPGSPRPPSTTGTS